MTDKELDRLHAEASDDLHHGRPATVVPIEVLLLVEEVRRLRGDLDRYVAELSFERDETRRLRDLLAYTGR